MFPQFEVLGYQIGTYGLMATIGCLVCGFLLCYMLKKRGLMFEDGILFLLFILGGVMIGGHLLYAITHIKHWPLLFQKTSFENWVQIAMAIFGGSVFYGGLFGGMIAGSIAGKVLKIDMKLWTDLMTPLVPLFHAFGRVGCFFAGCCYGIESKFGFITHTNQFVPLINGVTRFPVQLLEAVCNIILAIVLFVLLGKRENEKLKGNLIYIYLIAYGVIRFSDEFLRGDMIRGFVGVLSTSQFISIISIGISVFLLYRSLKSNKEVQICENEISEIA